jgi:hypothetical protein
MSLFCLLVAVETLVCCWARATNELFHTSTSYAKEERDAAVWALAFPSFRLVMAQCKLVACGMSFECVVVVGVVGVVVVVVFVVVVAVAGFVTARVHPHCCFALSWSAA